MRDRPTLPRRARSAAPVSEPSRKVKRAACRPARRTSRTSSALRSRIVRDGVGGEVVTEESSRTASCGPNTRSRVREWMPSAPTTRSKRRSVPLRKLHVDPAVTLLERGDLGRRTAFGAVFDRRRTARSASSPRGRLMKRPRVARSNTLTSNPPTPPPALADETHLFDVVADLLEPRHQAHLLGQVVALAPEIDDVAAAARTAGAFSTIVTRCPAFGSHQARLGPAIPAPLISTSMSAA